MIATALRLCPFVLLAFGVIIFLRLIKGNIFGGSVEAEMLAGWGRGKAKGVNRAERGVSDFW